MHLTFLGRTDRLQRRDVFYSTRSSAAGSTILREAFDEKSPVRLYYMPRQRGVRCSILICAVCERNSSNRGSDAVDRSILYLG